MDYRLIAKCIFTPLEYAKVGMEEIGAKEKYGEDNIDVYHTNFKPVKWNFLATRKDSCYIKVIVNKIDERVLGIHYLGPNAGDIMQGF